MDLALATGRGPAIVTDIEGRRPLVRDEDVVSFARRAADVADAEEHGSQRIEDTGIGLIDLAAIRGRGIESAMALALERLTRPDLGGFFIHLDCDALDDAIMPAVDYRMPGGLSWQEMATALGTAIGSGRAIGLEVTIFNPDLDAGGSVAGMLVDCLARGLRPETP